MPISLLSRNSRLLFFALSLAFFTSVEALYLFAPGGHTVFYYFRELAALLMLAAVIPVLTQFRVLRERGTVIKKLVAIYWGMTLLFLVYAIASLGSDDSQRNPGGHGLQALLPGTYVIWVAFLSLACIVLTGIFLLIRDLIFHKRKRATARNLNALILMIAGLSLYSVFLSQEYPTIQQHGKGGEILLFVLIVLMVLNAFRNSWVNYLNKKQKLNCLWLGLPLVAGAILFYVMLVQKSQLHYYNTALSTFAENTSLFTAIYVSMGYASLILHLPTAGIFDRKIREVESFQDLSRTVSSVIDPEEIIKVVVRESSRTLNSEVVWFELLDSVEGRLNIRMPMKRNGSTLDGKRVSCTEGMSGWLLERQDSILIHESDRHELRHALGEKISDLKSILGVPLRTKEGCIGLLYAASRESFAYDDSDRQILQAYANQATIAIENSRLIKALLEKERFEQELKVAETAQQKLLPRQMPCLPGIDLAAVCITANEVGGDYYDFFKLKDGLGIALGDVSGKGANAAFYMAELKGIMESLAHIHVSPRKLLINVNRTLARNLEASTFISLIYVRIDVTRKEMAVARAGHCPLLICPADGSDSRFVEPPGMGLGLDCGPIFDSVLAEETLATCSGDVLVFYTDGLIEARNTDRKEFEEVRLRGVVEEHRSKSAGQIKDKIVEEVRRFLGNLKNHDDLTFVVAKLV